MIATAGEFTYYRDTIDIDKASVRGSLFAAVSERTGIPPADLEDLEQHLFTKADEADACVDAAANEPGQGEFGGEKPSQATQLVELAGEAELFHTPDGDAYPTFEVEGHCETWPLKKKGFRRWLGRRFYERYGKVPGSQALQDALGVLEGQALYDGEEHEVHVRLAEHDEKIYLDLANDTWQAVEVSGSGWRIVDDPPVKFRRAAGMLPLPHPVRGGDLSELRSFVNVETDEDWALYVGGLFGAFQPQGPFPILAVHGEQGSAKSTHCRVTRRLIDPNKADLRSQPREERDLVIAANNGWYIALDNLSWIPPWLSDALCRLATGGGFGTRELYSDADEVLFDSKRPIVLNGIEELATRPDLIDRSLILYLPEISDENRRPEKRFWREFEAAHPRILGALLNAVSAALRNLPTTELPGLPRMADFALWVSAAETALGLSEGSFLEAYNANRESANWLALEGSLVAARIIRMAEDLASRHRLFRGTATTLLNRLEVRMPESDLRKRAWPANPQALSNKLRRLAPSLRAIGIEIEFHRDSGHERERNITIRTTREFRVRRVRRVRRPD